VIIGKGKKSAVEIVQASGTSLLATLPQAGQPAARFPRHLPISPASGEIRFSPTLPQAGKAQTRLHDVLQTIVKIEFFIQGNRQGNYLIE